MNERIKELWAQAAETTQDDSWEEQTKFMERYTQLIGRECLTLADSIRDGLDEDGEKQQALGAAWVGLAIERHFMIDSNERKYMTTDPEPEAKYDPVWCIEYCKSYAEQLRDKTRANRAEHAAECIEYLLGLVDRKWVSLTAEEIAEISEFHFHGALSGREFYDDVEAKLKEKNNG